MALRKETEDLAKITTHVFQTDWDWLKSTYLKTGASKALRQIVRAHRKLVEKKQKEAKGAMDVDVEIEA